MEIEERAVELSSRIILACVACLSFVACPQKLSAQSPQYCVGQLVGPAGTVGAYGMALSEEWAAINPQSNPSGYDACFFRVNTNVGRAIFKTCTVGGLCRVAGLSVRKSGLVGNSPGGPAVSVLVRVDSVDAGKPWLQREIDDCYNRAANVDTHPAACLEEKDRLLGRKLTAVYKQLLAASGRAKRKAVRREQRRWLKYQRRTCRAERNGFEAKEGSSMIGAAVEQTCNLRTTMERIKQLQSQ